MSEKPQEIFARALNEIFVEAEKLGLCAIEISSGTLSKRVGIVERMPSCCGAMRKSLAGKDTELKRETVIKNSSTNVFRYILPRKE